MKNTKRITSIIMTALLMGATVANAQILILSEDDYINSSRSNLDNGSLPNIPTLGTTLDQYAPLNGGILLLGCLGGAYLLGKRKKNDDK